MGGNGYGGVRRVGAVAVCLALGASGCLPVPPPLMYPSTPVPAGHFHLGGAVAGSVGMFGLDGDKAIPFPGLQLSGRYGLGHGASLGLSITGGPDLMLDGRLEVIHAPNLTLSVGAEVGAVGVPGPGPAAACTTTGPCGGISLVPMIAGTADVPVVLGLNLGRSTLWLGVRPGVVGGLPGQRSDVVPMFGGLVGFSTPIAHLGSLGFQFDLAHEPGLVGSYPETVVTAAVGISQ